MVEKECEYAKYCNDNSCLHWRDNYCPVYMQPITNKVKKWCVETIYTACYCENQLDIRKSKKSNNGFYFKCKCGVKHQYWLIDTRLESKNCKSCLDCGKIKECQKKKARTIRACAALANKYRNPWDKNFFSGEHCPLCILYGGNKLCSGCFMEIDDYTGDGCELFKSYQKARRIFYKNIVSSKFNTLFPSKKNYPNVPVEFIERARFFETIVVILDKKPPIQFTIKGEPFNLSRDM